MILVSITYCGYTVVAVVSIVGSVIAKQESMPERTSLRQFFLLCDLKLIHIHILLSGSAMNKGLPLLTTFESIRYCFFICSSRYLLPPQIDFITLIYLRVVKIHQRKYP
jgi:hypothetical protein